ncbi:TetR/AcrR family transcriptional regulator [Gilvimarinus agarilyticus]|uniref:TetR/AcrR family transcriptional regulator n=1 Tax=unclassified Gilvimarinus TaxID=2642066 RepID=UPI001C09F218|nr:MULTISPECIES: TetR/AcrR family transcriptional regulator [unclassified Gilvimarinus]MBU2884998.1 TetR/AcrR family transcriptional regulator [Gilvimarinus agarilyticus]MDO6569895.1 helix-turn-helix domain-containing protein [Gilvimarinus sp. 2_MG-2023]MDO6747104.1 helix-turn-helix domain-containing protein [Gilvimarinus sp. 1_MG-2023]
MPRSALYNREDALQKAVNLFWQRGFYATSLKDIERALDMRPGSLYAAFGNKQGLFNAAIDTYAGATQTEIKDFIEREGQVIVGLMAYLRWLLIDTPHEGPAACMVVKTLLESTDNSDVLHQKAVLILQQLEAYFAEVLHLAKAQGELVETVDCERLARLLQTQIMGARAFAHSNQDPQQIGSLLDDIEMIFAPYQTANHSPH